MTSCVMFYHQYVQGFYIISYSLENLLIRSRRSQLGESQRTVYISSLFFGLLVVQDSPSLMEKSIIISEDPYIYL